MDFTFLKKAGITPENAIVRFMGDEGLYARMLEKFLDDRNYENLVAAVDEKDEKAALTYSHTLKGLCGNLSMDRLFELFSEQVTLFRADKDDEAYALMKDIHESYELAVKTIKEWRHACNKTDKESP